MRDIARKAGVSVGTVSRALRGKSDVAPGLALRVLKEAQELGYIRRAAPATLRPGGLGTIGYLVDGDDNSPPTSDRFQQHFLAGIQRAAAERDGHTLFSQCQEERASGGLPQMVLRRLVGGVILKAFQKTPPSWIRRIDALCPAVLLMHRDPECDLPSVMCDNFGGTCQLLQYLRGLGHVRIGFVDEHPADGETSLHHLEREAAFRLHAPRFGCVVRPEYVQIRKAAHFGGDVTASMEAALAAFLALGRERPTAVVAATDLFALSLLRVAAQRGLAVPRDLSVAGFMNTDACRHAMPSLTSVCLSNNEIGAAALELLERRIRLPDGSPRHLIVPTRIVKRLSCAAPPSGI